MVIQRLMCLCATVFMPIATVADGPLPEDDCRRSAVGMIFPTSLPRAMVAEGRVVAARAGDLAAAYRIVETALRDAGYDPDGFAGGGRSWAAVVRDEDALVAVYERDQGRLIRVDAFGTETRESFVVLMHDVEQSLAHTPDDCGTAFGAIDAGITSAEGDQLIYSLRLGDGQQHVWGMHYRFHRRDGVLAHVDRLHVVCDADPTSLSEEYMVHMPERIRTAIENDSLPNHIKITGGTSMPGHYMPTEAQLLQLHLEPEYFFELVAFRMRDGIVRVNPEGISISNRWTPVASGCDVVEQPQAPDTG